MKTDYNNDFISLTKNFSVNSGKSHIKLDGHIPMEFLSLPFKSSATWVYPENNDYTENNSSFNSLLRYYCSNNRYSNELIFNNLEKPDSAIEENSRFRIPVFKPEKCDGSRFIILLHGLNEKMWTKYLPWAFSLAEQTGHPVLMFPIAFHMDRAPEVWAKPREMHHVADERKKIVPLENETSFINAALSHRIQFAPHRFFSAGMNTYYDIIELIDDIRQGAYPFINRNAVPDIFSYSIGASLSEVLITGNSRNFFDESKLFMFCGGAALDTANPVSKTIIDGEAYRELFRWLKTLFSSVFDFSRQQQNIFSLDNQETRCFKSFLFFDRMQSFREEALKKVSKQIKGLCLLKDRVFPPDITAQTLNGENADIGINFIQTDFPFEYRHEDPFPLTMDDKEAVNFSFQQTMSQAADFFQS